MKRFIGFLVVIIIMILIFGVYKYSEKISVKNKFDAYIHTNQYENDVFSSEVKYDSKIGEYFVSVIYKDYPNRTYIYYFKSDYILAIPLENDVQIETKDYVKGTNLE